jgi:hypothetical protein
MADPPAARRLNHGRGHSYELDGRRVPGVTSILNNGIPKPALVDWASRTTAGYAVDHWDELAKLTPSKRLRDLEEARWQSSRAAMARGTDVHKLAMQLAAGAEVDVPEPLAGHVDAYLEFVNAWQPAEKLVEVPVFNRAVRYAGTLDLVADLCDGATWLLDWKTGGTGVFPEVSLQMAAYRYAEFWLDAKGKEQPMPEIDFVGVVWLRADGFDFYPVEAGPAAFRTFQYAAQVAGFVEAAKESRELFIGESMPAPVAK